MAAKIPIDRDRIAEFCREHHIKELSFFGSVLRDDFTPESDVDVLVEFEPDAKRTLFDLVDMQTELEEMLARKVDLVSRRALHNPFRRHHILKTRQVLYVA